MAAQIHQGKCHAAGLGHHCGHRSTGGAHLETSHQHQVQDHVDAAGQKDEQQGNTGIAQSPKNAADAVIGRHKYHTAAADAQIGQSLVHGVGGHMHPAHGHGSQQPDSRRQHHCDHQEQANLCRHHPGRLPGRVGADGLSHQHRDTHGQTRHHCGNSHHHLTAHGYGSCGSSGSEASHHCQVHRTV